MGQHGIRLKSGTCLWSDGKWYMIVSMWNTVAASGAPDKQWLSAQSFETLEAADRYYFVHGRKIVRELSKTLKRGLPGGSKLIHRELRSPDVSEG